MIQNSFHSLILLLGRLGLLVVVSMVFACATTPDQQVEFDQDKKSRTHYAAGVEYLRQGKPALAIRELRTALQISPRDPWNHWAIAEAYRHKGKLDETEKHLLVALEIRPDFQQAKLNLSALYVQVGRYDAAIRLADELLDDPTFPVPWKALTNKGWAQYRLGQSQPARASFESALEYNEEHWRSHLALGILDAEGGQPLKALEEFERVLELEPGTLALAEANYRIGEIYVSLGNRERAVQHLTAATQNEPNGEWGKRSEDYLKRLR